VVRTRARHDERGLAELAVVIVPTLLLVLGVMHAALFWYGQAVATRAAHHGLDQTRVLGGSPADGEAVALQLLDQTGVLDSPQVAASQSATQATVTVTGQALSMLPGVSLSVTATASGPVERIEP
jgi:hypothetical protein